MKRNLFNLGTRLVPLASAIAIASATASQGATLVDAFSDASLSEYTLTKVNDSVSGTNVSFTSPAGALQVAYAGTAGVEQVLFLRSDFSLLVGQTLTVDVSMATSTTSFDFGLAIAGATTPTGVTTTGDTRSTAPWLSISARPAQDAIRVNTSGAVLLNGSVTQPTYSPALITTGSGNLAAVETTIASLFIQRSSSTAFTLGYFDTSAVRHDALTVNFVSATDVGTQIGFYADLRGDGTLGNFDNLQIIPEPSTALLGALGGLALLRRRR